MAIAAAGAIVLCLAPSLQAQISNYGPKGLPAMTNAMGEKGGQGSTVMPGVLGKVGIEQRLNSAIAAQPHLHG